MHFLSSYGDHKVELLRASLKVQKGCTKVNIKLVEDFDVESIPFKFQQHDSCNLCYRATQHPPTHAGNDNNPPV